MARVRLALIACATLALGMIVSAALIGVSGSLLPTNVPRTQFVGPNVLGALDYNAATRHLSLNIGDTPPSTPFSSRFEVGQPLLPHFTAPVANALSLDIKVLTDDGLAYSGNGVSDDFIMTGSVDLNGNSGIDPGESGTLLTGSLLQFGFNNASGASPDGVDFRFAVTGGILAPRFAGKDIGVRNIMESSSWPNANVYNTAFLSSFQATAKGDVAPFACGSSIGDFVWNDVNRNGVQDPGEPGLNGITVRLRNNLNVLLQTVVTGNGGAGNQPGYFRFPGLCLGSYGVEVDQATALPFIPTTTGAGTPSTDSNVNPSPVSIVPANYVTGDQTVDFGFKTPCSGVIGDFVWHDLNRDGLQTPGEPGLQGVKVRLLTPGGAEIATTTSGANGAYTFGGLCAGSYRIDVDSTTVPAGFALTDTHVGADPTIDSNTPMVEIVSLSSDSATETTIDFGFNGLCEGVIGDYVWFDVNHDGIQDAGEAGIDGLPVTLNGPGGVRNTTTGVNPNDNTKHGYYQFTGLCTGNYTVDVQAPAGFTPSPQFAGGNPATDSDGPVNGGPATAVLANDLATNQTIDFGFLSCPGTIGDFVWQDTNLNGLQDPGEPGYPGVVVNLRRTSDNAIIQSATTGGDGLYAFQGLCPGNYKIQVDPPAGAGVSPALVGPDRQADSDLNPTTVTLTVGSPIDASVDFGYLPTGSIGDRVWNDVDGDGVQDGGEAGLAGWTVNIFGPYGYMNAQVTGANGIYSFNNLVAGSYTVCVNTMAGYDQTYDLDGLGTPSCASRAILEGVHATDVDFGYRQPASIGDRVWNDFDGDGVQDGGEPGLAGWEVSISGPMFASSQIAGADGIYRFTNLAPGAYTVCVVPQAGYVQTYDLDGLGTPQCASRTVAAGESANDVDFGYRQPVDLRITKTDGVTVVSSGATTTYTVVVTNNGPNEVTGAIVADPAPAGLTLGAWTCAVSAPGAGGVVVTACGAANGSGPVNTTANLKVGGAVTYTIAATVTAAGGTVTNIASVTPPADRTNTGASCVANGGTFNAQTGACSASDTDLVPNGTIGDFIWNDLNNDGIQSGSGEVGTAFANIPVTLLDSTGAVTLKTTNADANGFYLFTGVGAGSYIVRVPITAGYNPSPALQGGNPANDSNGITAGAPAGFVQGAVTLTTNSSNDLTIDFGFNTPGGGLGNGGMGTIGNFVWYDQNLNGLQDAGEPGIANVHLEITGALNFIDHQTTDINGFYLFTGLKAGSYTVTMELPPGYLSTLTGKGNGGTVCVAGAGAALCDSNINPSVVNLATDNSNDLTIDFGLTMGQELCPPAGSSGPATVGTLYWGVDNSGNVYVRYDQNRGINDNSYGTGAIQWPSGHKFSDLTGSDKAQFKFTNMAGTTVLDFYMDYISAKSGTPSGYASLGASGGDGSMVTGSAAHILSYDTSLAKNLNGLCVGGNCTVSGVTLTTNSPPATPNTNSGQATGAFAGKWNFTDSFEVKIAAAAFGASGFGGVSIGQIHNSPAKAGSNAVTPAVCGPLLGACVLGYPFTSAVPRTSTVFNENEVLAAFGLTRTATQDTVQLWAADEHATLLGVRTAGMPVSAMNGNPGRVTNPLVGDPTKTDPFGRPIHPAIYITDVTGLSDNASHTDLAYRAGDWQLGGTPIAPHDIFGTWKGASVSGTTFTTDANPAKNTWNLGPGSDTPAGGFGTLTNQGYGFEGRWNVNDLRLNGQPLIVGRSYRIQFIVHDGDQNKTGGDVGQACVIMKKMAPIPTPTADLAVTKTNGVSSVTAGSATTYSVVVTNNGASAANNAVLTDPIATGLNKTSVVCTSAAGGASCPAPANVTVALLQGAGIVLPTLPPGGSVTFAVVATVTGSGTVTNTASVAPPPGVLDNVPANNAASDSDTVVAELPKPKLTLTKASSVSSVKRNVNFTYTLTYKNIGNATATNVTIKDVLPSYVSFVSATGGGVNSSGTVNWTVASLAPGAQGSVTVTVKGTSTKTVSNTGTAKCNEVPTPVSSNAVSTTITS